LVLTVLASEEAVDGAVAAAVGDGGASAGALLDAKEDAVDEASVCPLAEGLSLAVV
jgi:hypothetical protein